MIYFRIAQYWAELFAMLPEENIDISTKPNISTNTIKTENNEVNIDLCFNPGSNN